MGLPNLFYFIRLRLKGVKMKEKEYKSVIISVPISAETIEDKLPRVIN